MRLVDKAGVSPSFPLLNFPTVPDHNPANFFGVPMRFSGRAFGEAFPGQEGDSDDTKTRTLVGLRGRIPDGTSGLPGDNWTWELSGAYERATRNQGNADVVWPRFVLAVNGLGGAECPVNVGQGLEGGIRAIVDPRAAETLDLGAINANLDNLVSSDRVLAAGPGQNGCEYFNPFGSALIEPEQGNSLSLTRWLLGPGGAHNLRTSTTTTLKLIDGVIRGDVWTLPAGPAELALSYQFRQDEYDVRRDLGQQVTRMYVFIAGGNSFTSEQDMHAIGAELRLPVHEQLEVHAAVRWSDYGGSVGSSVDPKLALRWQINDWLSFRASAGTTFRAPTLSQKRSERTATVFVTDLLNPVFEAFSDLPTFDFRAGDIVGNIDLKPEETVTYNAGLIARPFDAWQVTLDYWRIVFDDRMAPQSFQRVVDAENSITGAIFLQEGCSTRLIAAAEDLGVLRNPLTCEIERIRARYVNTAGVVTDGIDLISSYGIDLHGLGDLRLSFSGSHIIQYVISGDNSRDVSGQLNRNSFARPLPKYKFNVQAAWARDQHRAFLTWRHISPYENDLSDRLLNGTKISAWNTFDFVYSRGVGDRTTFTLGVSNMFDQDPPAVHGLDLQYDPWTHSPFGRMLYTELKVRLD